MAAPGTSQPNPAASVSVDEPTRLLGISPSTVRRMVRAGTLRAARVERPQGSVIRIVLRPRDLPPPSTGCAAAGVGEGAASPVDASAGSLVPLECAEAMAAYSARLLAPVMEQVRELARRLESLASENGRPRAELAGARERILALEALKVALESAPDTDVVSRPAARPWWRLW
jgi:excisionase family DNA binding protein